ncbi:hypothetical protein HPB48_010845 [Haemaphysalis longicornis]|uniref:Sulfotransferase domain-containing protein n=1 Tax=Haemaphysalis longicornis TaxID=44386 RepID=A0A9J6GKZ8_HAELO|nr:hypothetical protein HPB48_010845 [Haemaphysalis longicornis]
MDPAMYQDIDGVWMHKFFPVENVRSAMKYKPRDGDIIVVTYPKCGTNWAQYIVYNILTRGNPPADVGEYSLMSPFIDLTGANASENPSRFAAIMTHLPLHAFTPVDQAKYIYVARNPYDCAVSFYHFILGMTPKSITDVSFGRFLDLFLSGKVLYGDYFDHLLPWYGRRVSPNVLFMTYEDMKADLRAEVLNIADFLGEDHGKALREDDELVTRIMDACSLENMKVFFKDNPKDRVEKMAQAASKSPIVDQAPLKEVLSPRMNTHEGSGFVRKGIVGDWKNHFTADQIKMMKAWIASKTRGSDVMKIWSSLDLP